jgi:hypothetical protein
MSRQLGVGNILMPHSTHWDKDDKHEINIRLPTLGQRKTIGNCSECGCPMQVSNLYVRPFMNCTINECPAWDFDAGKCICEECPKILRYAEVEYRKDVYKR